MDRIERVVAARSYSDLSLGVLDQSPIPEGRSAGEALRNSIDLAKLAEDLGYNRYWVAEHHGTPGLACTSPEALIGPIASATSTIRVGSGGIMLPHYSPLKVAETFSMLAGLYPGRIELGIGRAAGTSPALAFALQRDRRQRAPDDFPDQLQELMGYFGERPPAETVFPQRITGALQFCAPRMFLLGSSPQSAVWAAELGLPYVFADFINPEGAISARYYRNQFEPSTSLKQPHVAVAAWAICAETEEEAQQLALSARMMMALLRRGELIAVPTVEHARKFIQQQGVSAEELTAGRRFIVGTPKPVRAAIESLVEEYEADEVLLVNILHSHAARRRSYELIASEFGLRRERKAVAGAASEPTPVS